MVQAAERAYASIRDGILAGAHPQGARLLEEELAEAIGVSRTPVRDALRRLQADGLVELGTGRSAQVVSYSDEDLAEIFELRALLESHAHARAAAVIDAPTLAHLTDLAGEMERLAARPRGRWLELIAERNRDFHWAIIRAAGSPRLELLLQQVVHVPLVHRTFQRYTPEALQRSFAHHRELISALLAGDGDWAGAVMRSHVHAARAVLLGGDT